MLECFFFQAEDGIRDLVRSRGLGDVYKRQPLLGQAHPQTAKSWALLLPALRLVRPAPTHAARSDKPELPCRSCLLYTSDAADERSSVDLGGRRILQKKTKKKKIYKQRASTVLHIATTHTHTSELY